MKCTEICVLKQGDEVRLGGFLQGTDRRALELHIGLYVAGNLADKTLERQLADEEVGTLLEAADLAKCNLAGRETMQAALRHYAGTNHTRAKAVRLLDAARCGGRLAQGFGHQSHAGLDALLRLVLLRLACGLLGASHSTRDARLQREIADALRVAVQLQKVPKSGNWPNSNATDNEMRALIANRFFRLLPQIHVRNSCGIHGIRPSLIARGVGIHFGEVYSAAKLRRTGGLVVQLALRGVMTVLVDRRYEHYYRIPKGYSA